MTAADKRRTAIGFIVCLGIVSLFADMTYEGAYSIISPFLKGLGTTAFEVSFITGLGEMLGASLRYFSGRLADRTRAYWTITFLGYAMNVIAVPALAFAGNWKTAAILVVAERTGKAFRGPARDVLLSEATQEVGHGFGFGLHSAMDQTGAIVGPLLMWLGFMRTGSYGKSFLWLFVPAVGTLLALTVARILHPNQGASAKIPNPQMIPKVFWYYTAAAGLLAFGFVDFSILAYRFADANVATGGQIPLLYAGAMAVEGLTAFLFGKLFDSFGVNVLVLGTLVSMLSLPLGFFGGGAAVIAAVGCWATGMGAQDACLRSGIAQVVSMNKRGSAFGAFNGVWGILWFLGTLAMGALYAHSLVALVTLGVVAQLAAAIVFLSLRRNSKLRECDNRRCMPPPERLARRVAVSSIVISAALAIAKILIGLSANSVSLISDGVESAADFFTSGLVLLGLWVASKPADKEHPYGHGRFEILVGLAIGAVLIATGTGISIRALEQRHEATVPALYAIWPLLASIVAKAALGASKFRLGRRSGSAGLQADAWNDVVDVLSGTIALIAILLSTHWPRELASADHYGGFAIGLIVIFLGFRVVRETVLQLMDTMPDESQMSQIKAAALKVPGVQGIEKCFARKTGLRYHVDLHLEVDPNLTVKASHEIARSVKNRIKSDLDWIEDVLVHVEPYESSGP